MRYVLAITTALVLAAVALYSLVSGRVVGAAIMGGVALITALSPMLDGLLRRRLGLQHHLWFSILFCMVAASGSAALAVSTASSARALLWLSSVMFSGLAVAGVVMSFKLRAMSGSDQAEKR